MKDEFNTAATDQKHQFKDKLNRAISDFSTAEAFRSKKFYHSLTINQNRFDASFNLKDKNNEFPTTETPEFPNFLQTQLTKAYSSSKQLNSKKP